MKRLLFLVITISILMVGCNINSAPSLKEETSISHEKPSILFHILDEHAKPVCGFGLEIYDESQNLIDTVYSDKDGNIQKDYPYGNYFFKDLPNQYDYLIDKSLYKFKVSDTTRTITIQLAVNKKPRI